MYEVMRKCNTCELEWEDSFFTKFRKLEFVGYFKLCFSCREKGRIANERRKEKKSQQAKEHYQQYKDDISKRNKEYREKNKDKLREYEKSESRKEFHSNWVKAKRKEEPHRFIFYSAKHRAKKDNIPFSITQQDVISVYPADNRCPVLGLLLRSNLKKTQDNSPSLDRIVPERGYVKDNIVVISHRANRIKNNATLEELEKIIVFLKSRAAL